MENNRNVIVKKETAECEDIELTNENQIKIEEPDLKDSPFNNNSSFQIKQEIVENEDEEIEISKLEMQSFECNYNNNFKCEADHTLKVCKTENHYTGEGFHTPNADLNSQNIENTYKFMFETKHERLLALQPRPEQSSNDIRLKQEKDEIKCDLKSLISSKIYTCQICSFQTTDKSLFNQHISSNHDYLNITIPRTKIDYCQFCDKLFTSKELLDDHLQKEHKVAIKRQMKNVESSKIYLCNICSYKTIRKFHLNRHIRRVHNEHPTKINCKFCNKSFANKRSCDEHILKQHKSEIKSDTKDLITSKIHSCSSCSYQTVRKSKLNVHISSTHTGQVTKMNYCEFCDKSFKTKQSLDNHMLNQHKQIIKNDLKRFITHKIHSCTICCYETTYKNVYKSHMISLHNAQRIKINCMFCDRSFTVKKAIDDHLLKQHKDKIKNNKEAFITNKIHSCSFCSYQTTRKAHLNLHFNAKHNKRKLKQIKRD